MCMRQTKGCLIASLKRLRKKRLKSCSRARRNIRHTYLSLSMLRKHLKPTGRNYETGVILFPLCLGRFVRDGAGCMRFVFESNGSCEREKPERTIQGTNPERPTERHGRFAPSQGQFRLCG